MPVLSIVACEMLEDELVHVLSIDNDIKQLYLVENTNSFRLARKLKSRGMRPFIFPFDRLSAIVMKNSRDLFSEIILRFPKFSIFKKIHYALKAGKCDHLIIVVNLLPKDLHADTDRLHSEVYRNARDMAKFSDGILLFYGKCAYSYESKTKLKSLDCPVYFLKDNNSEVVEDCISTALGGNDAYTKADKLGKGKGVFYVTPMWINYMKEEIKPGRSSNDYKYLNDPNYSLLFKVNRPDSDNADFSRNASEFAKTFDMDIININGTMKIATDSYMNAKLAVCKDPD
ncbi:hypothetical protein J2755_001280 [Methanohalophilus levihalophilus]|uniref:DUF1638 domain-containing protein n=1 Tax=Methanohalophilus levihalophilus TaxID=1431282 RepID=UPI001AE7593A|nr:DUF1638 domain-containing protein [Methanohalophilus levihalophilus]MBP2030346.1 hypothetical protein [Methanohalophilus levihalophilus]